MKNIFKSIFAVALSISMICGTALTPVFAEGEIAEPEKVVKHHLDMGVYCTMYDGTKWTSDKQYRQEDTVEVNLDFKRNIKVLGAHVYQGESDVFQFNRDNGDTWNIPVTKESVPEKEDNNKSDDEGTADTTLIERSYYESYKDLYGRKTPTKLSLNDSKTGNASPTVVHFEYNLKIESEDDLDACAKARELVSEYVVTREVNKTITTVIKDDTLQKEKDALLKDYEKLSNEVKLITKEVASLKADLDKAPTRTKYETWHNASVKLKQMKAQMKAIYSQYTSINVNNSVKTTSQIITEIQTSHEFSEQEKQTALKNYEEKIYTYWGGKTGLAKQAWKDGKINSTVVDKGSVNIYNALESAFSKGYSENRSQMHLVFVPIVIEYEENSHICEKCGLCEIDPISKVCTKESCPHFGTEECGCYEPPEVAFTPSSTCAAEYTWVETHTHKVSSGHTSSCPSDCHKSHTKTCTHYCEYKASLSISPTLTPATPMKDKVNGLPTFKSGYGFAVTCPYTLTVTQLNTDTGSRCGSHRAFAHSAVVSDPTKSYVATDWKVEYKNSKGKKVTQGKTIELEKSGKSFVCKANPVSETNKKLIYTDVDLSGTKKSPKKHSVTVYVQGGKVTYQGKTQELCKDAELQFVIAGNMYEDDVTVETR